VHFSRRPLTDPSDCYILALPILLLQFEPSPTKLLSYGYACLCLLRVQALLNLHHGTMLCHGFGRLTTLHLHSCLLHPSCCRPSAPCLWPPSACTTSASTGRVGMARRISLQMSTGSCRQLWPPSPPVLRSAYVAHERIPAVS
jgi:hypothetical protein